MDRRANIIALNDQLRTTFKGGRVQMTPSVFELDDRLRGRALSVLARYDSFHPDSEHDWVRLFLLVIRSSGGSNIAVPTVRACPLIQRMWIRRFVCSRYMPLMTYWHRLGAPCGPGTSRVAPRAPADPEDGKPSLGRSGYDPIALSYGTPRLP